ncbi:MAG: gamma-glutamyl-gamma-aminobutyrate hydrolase family protein, partial [Acidobacteria bacterium]|nr:gamma-glutamyl-gamma-aminobutyrate hydrolase family protein [Acidobacteriota bacterium]
VANNLRVNVTWIESENLMKDDYETELHDFDAILVPGGFGKRGISGMLRAIKYARRSGTPYFGICLGMQTACIEFARSVCGLRDADSTEFNEETPFPIIFKLRDLVGVDELGGTMRLGEWACRLKDGSLAREIYGGQEEIGERHRHRFEFNPEYRQLLEKEGLVFSGISPDGKFVEMIELDRAQHPFFVACQFHPEYKSKPLAAHPLFTSFVKAAWENRLNSENLQHDVTSDRQPQTQLPEAMKENA